MHCPVLGSTEPPRTNQLHRDNLNAMVASIDKFRELLDVPAEHRLEHFTSIALHGVGNMEPGSLRNLQNRVIHALTRPKQTGWDP